MRKLLRWLGLAFGGLAVLLLIGAGSVWYASERALARHHQAAPERLAVPTPQQLADGPRQLRTLGCLGCHGEGLRGDRMFSEPGVATIWAPNLTLVAAHATDQQLAQAIRQGISHDGRALWIMPSGLFSRLSDSETATVIAAIRSLPRGGEATPPIAVGPLARFGIVTGDFESAPQTIADFQRRIPLRVGPEHEPGRRIAAIVCADCHAPDLSGGGPGPSANSPDLAIAAAYDLEQFRTLMRSGRPPSGRDLGLMGAAAREDLSHFTDSEIAQLHGYLQARAARLSPPAAPAP
jgi:cytochrome c553